MTIFDACRKVLELNERIEQNIRVLKAMVDKEEKYEEYTKLFQTTLSLIDEMDFYKNQISEIENLYEIKSYQL